MHDAMADSQNARAGEAGTKPGDQDVESVASIQHGRIETLCGEDSTPSVLDRQPR